MNHLHHSQFKMRGCEANILQALLQGKRRLFICTCVHFIIIIFTSGKQQMLVEEDSRLAAASVVGIGSPSSPSPHRRHHHQPHLSPVLLYGFILKSREIAAQLLASHGQHCPA